MSSPNDSSLTGDGGVVRNGDEVELVHIQSKKLLNRFVVCVGV